MPGTTSSDFDATLISETHLRRDVLLTAVTEAKKSGWARYECRSAHTGPKALVFQAPVNLQ